MGVFSSVASAVQGAFWLVRSTGLRDQIRTLQRVQDQHRRWQARDLRAFEHRVYSQNGEDGILKEIFRRIGTSNKFFVEFGVETGKECNCARLVREDDWSGLFLEASDELFPHLEKNFRAYANVRCHKTAVTSANIEELLAANKVPTNLDLLSIDIDGNDYWVWKAITRWQARVVAIEYNAAYPPPIKWVMKEDPNYRWNGTNYHGASLTSLSLLGRQKGYTLVGTDSRGVNAFFVRNELVDPEQFVDTALFYHYSPFNHPLCPNGHPPFKGPFVEI
jgi:hypothetical protein